ncbi:S8 family peptidase [Cognatishimia activa]|uniref:S8 family serine peptidase n=1 Tax=Cognatishimia activa TaxID=1715691 RepID=A0A975I883_9RHOB|nr:S8 family peptidase [Cognatishimia activa]QTN37003.1 S8 family serine peptidase [Cognatishimia activa]
MTNFSKFALLAPMAIALGACGGGDSGSGTGGGTGGTSTANTIFSSFFVQSWSAYQTAATNLLATSRYANQVANGSYYSDINGNRVFDAGIDVRLNGDPIRHSGAHFAHAAGLSGTGQLVAIADSGFLTTHEAISDSLNENQSANVDTHGTFVASVITGNSGSMIGIAPSANLIIGDTSTYQSITNVGTAALSKRAVAWNNSWGFNNRYATTSDYNAIFTGAAGQQLIDAFQDYAAYGNVVFALSNTHGETQTDLMGGLPILVPALQDGWIAVVNAIPTMTNDDVTSVERVSSACLGAAAWCITADGTWSHGATSVSNTDYDFGTGTSYAAPVVSGALALLAEAFPALTPHQLRLRLFATADNSFTGFTTDQVVTLADGYQSAVSNEYGHGFLDIAAALLPIGTITVNSANGTAIDARQPLVMSGTAAGAAVRDALVNVDLLAVDSFAGAFTIDASDLVQATKPNQFFTEQSASLHGYTTNDRHLSTALFDRDPTLQNSFGDLYVAAYMPNTSGAFETAGFSVGQRHTTSFGHIDWQAGIGSDNGALLPMWQNQDGQDLASLGLAMTSALSENSALQVSAVMATSAGRGNTSSIFMNSSEVTYTQAQVFDRKDRLKLSLRQPFAITSGSTNLTLATNSGGTYQLQTFAVDLSPAKREMQIALDYEIEVQRDTDVMLSLVHAMNRGHQAGKEESGVFFGYRKSF